MAWAGKLEEPARIANGEGRRSKTPSPNANTPERYPLGLSRF